MGIIYYNAFFVIKWAMYKVCEVRGDIYRNVLRGWANE